MASKRFARLALDASASCKLRAEFCQTMLAHPLDRRESDAWIRVSQKARQDRRASGPIANPAGSAASPAARSAERPFEPASAASSAGWSEFRKPSRAAC